MVHKRRYEQKSVLSKFANRMHRVCCVCVYYLRVRYYASGSPISVVCTLNIITKQIESKQLGNVFSRQDTAQKQNTKTHCIWILRCKLLVLLRTEDRCGPNGNERGGRVEYGGDHFRISLFCRLGIICVCHICLMCNTCILPQRCERVACSRVQPVLRFCNFLYIEYFRWQWNRRMEWKNGTRIKLVK